MESALILVVDQGTHATRALAFDLTGKVIAAAQKPVGLSRISADQIEQDASEIATTMRDVISSVLADEQVRRRDVAYAGLATQRSSVVAWNRATGEPLAPLISWQDRRAAELLHAFKKREKVIKERTGLPLSPHYGASKLRWLLDNSDEVEKARRHGQLKFGPLASFLLFHLLRERPFLVDHANAARTQLWNIDSRDWDPMLLEMFGVPVEFLPRCRPVEDAYGLLHGNDIPLMAVNGDQNAAVFNLGSPAPGTAIINLGTGAFVLMPTGARRVRHSRLLSGLASSDDLFGDYTIEGTVNGGAAALRWAAKRWQITDVMQRLPAWLDQIQDPPIFLNSIGGLGSPYWCPGPAPAIVGDGGLEARMVAVVESILFLLQVNLEEMVDCGLKLKRIRVSGGLAILDGLCQRLADLSGKVVYRPAETEATARGVAWLAAGRPDYWPEAQTGREFSPERNEGLEERYRRFRDEIERYGRRETV